MKLLAKLIGFFSKAKTIAVTVKNKVDTYIKEHKKQIKILMTIFEAIFPAQTGAKKMACVVRSICTAIGYEAASEEVIDYIQNKCQSIYDEFKDGLDNG